MTRRRSPVRRKAARAKSIFARAASPISRSSPFARARLGLFTPSPASHGIGADELSDRRRWADSLPKPDSVIPADLDDLRSYNVLLRLESLGVSPEILEKLSVIEWDKWYFVRIIVEDYESEHADGEAPPGYGMGSRRTIAFFGLGSRILVKLMDIAQVRTILDVVVKEAAPGGSTPLRPVFGGTTITLADGSTVNGSGKRFPTPAKRGAPFKPRGRWTREQAARIIGAEKKRGQRADKLAARIAKLQSQGAKGKKKAAALARRSAAAWTAAQKKKAKPRRKRNKKR